MKSLLLLLFLTGTASVQPSAGIRTNKPAIEPDSIYSLAVKPENFPDEAVVWLLDEGMYKVEADGRTSRTMRQVVQILKPEGANGYRERQFSWNPDHDKFTLNWMRVLKPNGEVISEHPEQIQDSDVPAAMGTPMYTATKVRRISLSGLDAGTILDFSTTTETATPMMPGEFMFPWRVMTGVPVMRSNLVVDIPAGLNPNIVERNLNFKRRESTDKNRKIYTWAASNVPKLKNEPFAPDSIIQGMQVSISPSFKWAAIGDWYSSIATPAYTIPPSVEQKISTVLTGARSLDDSIAALHKWVAQDIRYVAIELGRGGYVPRDAETVVRTGFGDCKDKAMLFLASLKKIGVTGYPVLLNISGRASKDQPSLGQFNHMIAAVNVRGAMRFADLTAGSYPFGHLPRSEQGSLAVLVKEKTGEQINLPKASDAETSEEATIIGTLGEDGNFSGNVVNYWTGDFAPPMRSVFQTAPDSARRKIVGRALAGQFLERPETDSLIAFDGKDLRSQAKVTTRVTKAKMISRAGELSLLVNPIHPPQSYPGLADLLDGMKDRKLPFDAKFFAPMAKNHIDVRIKLPMGWTATLPKDINLDGPVGRYIVTYTQKGNELHIEKTTSGTGAVIPASRKAEIVDFLRKASSDDAKLIPIKAPIHSVASIDAEPPKVITDRRALPAVPQRSAGWRDRTP
ncbi:MAG TPA: DUF3857 domain-containing protein [Gemmatimonadaceae bacterium]|nr:DUF3857 domain-containing protein [Gemmatimonadaceae bacterium]